MNDIATSSASSSAQDIETAAWHALPAQAVLEQLSGLRKVSRRPGQSAP